MSLKAFGMPIVLFTMGGLFAPASPFSHTGALLAQEEVQEQERADREECDCSIMRLREGARALRAAPELRAFFGPEVRLGILVRDSVSSDGEHLGARVVEVVPESGAEDAGLAEGDVVVSVNGTNLTQPDTEARRSGASRRMVELVRGLEPGDIVTVEYLRDGQRRTAEVEVQEHGPRHFRAVLRNAAASIPHPDSLFPEGMLPPEMADHLQLRALQRQHIPQLRASMRRLGAELGFLGLQLAELNSGLGEYFGEERGVLVLEAPPEDSGLGLEAGDVILSIDGREVERPGHARRILASYGADEVAELEVLRHGERITVTARPGERRIDPEG